MKGAVLMHREGSLETLLTEFLRRQNRPRWVFFSFGRWLPTAHQEHCTQAQCPVLVVGFLPA